MSGEGARRWPRWARALVGAFAVIGLFYVALIVMFWMVACTTTSSAIVPSPSGAFVAEISERECHGGPPRTEVTVGRADGRAFSTVFQADAKPDGDGGFKKVAVRIAWTDADELEVYYPWTLRFQSRVDSAEGAKIAYHEVPPRP